MNKTNRIFFLLQFTPTVAPTWLKAIIRILDEAMGSDCHQYCQCSMWKASGTKLIEEERMGNGQNGQWSQCFQVVDSQQQVN